MEPIVFAVRVGDKYGPHYEDYINSKVPNVHWIKEEVVGPKQWNKLYPMSLDIDEPVVVIDIDMMLINDYMDAINHPIERGEFLAARSWWGDTKTPGYNLQGGFQKYYPKDCKYIYEEFVSKVDHWTKYYYRNRVTTKGMGEQYFVEDMARQKLTIRYLPDAWITRWENDITPRIHRALNLHYSQDWLHLGGEFHQEVKLVHFLDQSPLDKEGLEALSTSETFGG